MITIQNDPISIASHASLTELLSLCYSIRIFFVLFLWDVQQHLCGVMLETRRTHTHTHTRTDHKQKKEICVTNAS